MILGQLENADIPKKRRKYNVITQILSLTEQCQKILEYFLVG